jgi:hypothetical protein
MDARLNLFSNQTAGKMLKYCEYAPPPPGRECLSGTLVLTMTATAAPCSTTRATAPVRRPRARDHSARA